MRKAGILLSALGARGLRDRARRTGRPRCRCRRRSARGSIRAAGRPERAAATAAAAAPTRRARRAAGSAAPAAAVGPGAHFWRELGDTTLDRLIGELLRANLDVRTARGAGARRAGGADRGGARSGAHGHRRRRLHPAAALERDVPDRRPARSPTRTSGTAGSTRRGSSISSGGCGGTLQAQGALVGAAEEDLRDVQVSLTAELARTYFELRGAQERLAVARRNAENQRRTLEVTRQRLDAGRGTAFDTERARAQLGFTLASIPAARGAGGGGAVPDRRAGRPPAGRGGRASSAGRGRSRRCPPSWRSARPTRSIRRRPDVAAAERQVAAERAFVGAAKADYLPRITVGGSAGYSARRRSTGWASTAPSATRWARSSPGRRSTWAG